MKLYYSPGACSLAAHIILNEINVDFDLEKVNLKTHQTEKGANYYDINPKGYVPALEINPGLILTENVAILPFLAQHDPKQDLIPKKVRKAKLIKKSIVCSRTLIKPSVNLKMITWSMITLAPQMPIYSSLPTGQKVLDMI